MLSRTLVASLAVVLGALFGPAATGAESGVVCLPGGGPCTVEVVKTGVRGSADTKSISGRGAQRSTERKCEDPFGFPVDCYIELFGWWNPSDKCHYRREDPQPPRTAAVWEGRTDGSIYGVVCGSIPGAGPGGGWVWLAEPPPGYGGGALSPAELAVRAVERLPLAKPVIGMAPRPGTTGLVGLPVWLWLERAPQTWGPVSATASVPGLSVTATAEVAQVVWDMGDGSTVTCTTPGIPYTRAQGGRMSPECGHMYDQPSSRQPGGAYTVSATTTWQISWSGGGDSGQLTRTRSASLPVRIGELQVLVS